MADVEWKVAGVGVTHPARPGARPYRIAGGGMALVALLLSLLALLPLGFVVGITLETDWDTIKALVFRPRVGELLLNTVLLVAVTLPLCTLLGVGAGLADRAHHIAGPSRVVAVVDRAAGGAGLCSKLRLD